MNVVSAATRSRHLSGAGHVRSNSRLGGADFTGSLALVVPALLGAYFVSGVFSLQLATYGICLVAVLPHVGPFVASLRKNPANLMLVLLFTALAMSTLAAFGSVSSSVATLQAKALAATAVWASIYIITFSSLRTSGDVLRLTRWLSSICLIITASVYLSALLHLWGLSFGEVLEFSDGTFRVFGPLGDNVSFLLVLPILMSLVGSRPIMFGIHVGALLLTATRGAAVCAVIGVLAYLLLAPKSLRSTRKLMIWNVVVVAVVGCVVWLSPVSAVLMDRLSAPSMRTMAIQMGISAFQESPLLGTGFNGFSNSRPAVVEDWLIPRQAENALSRTTNQYVQTAVDGGVIALACLLLFVLCTARNALRVIGWRSATPQLVALHLWLISVLAGNQGALWLLANTASGFFIFVVAGLAAKASVLAAEQTVPRRRVA